jgi:hypothetical protein
LNSHDQKLRFAIANRRLIEVHYHGKQRIAEPHDYGVIRGTERVFVYQRSQAGRVSDKIRGWRMLELSDIEACTVLDQTFDGSRRQPHQRHYEWDVLYARVE